MEILIIRHGKTYGNSIGRYNGTIDDPLCDEGIEQARQAGSMDDVRHVFVTPLSRTKQTAAICFKNARQTVVEGLREMCFGDFEGRTSEEMQDDPQYRAWLDSNCVLPCPNGEGIASFTQRVRPAFIEVIDQSISDGKERVFIVAHGGTIMAIMSSFAVSDKTYFDYFCKNCQGYKIIIDEKTWLAERKFSAFERVERLGR
ncbi:MAG: histidine phosphatase family protein [Clostridia bacterium]|nr:histidine phosphatase family protein [Clostridia bacterium]